MLSFLFEHNYAWTAWMPMAADQRGAATWHERTAPVCPPVLREWTWYTESSDICLYVPAATVREFCNKDDLTALRSSAHLTVFARINGAIPNRPKCLRVAAELLLRGESLAFVGRRLGISRERVRQYFSLLPGEVREQWLIHKRLRREQRRVQPLRIPAALPNGKYRPEYQAFRNMLQRCLNPNHPNHDNYGGRGVRVCDDWNPNVVGLRDGFRNFMRDMGARPPAQKNGRAVYSINRKDNVLLYSGDTCEWTTQKGQCGPNQRRARRKKMTVQAGGEA
jgi:hypothetical protein